MGHLSMAYGISLPSLHFNSLVPHIGYLDIPSIFRPSWKEHAPNIIDLSYTIFLMYTVHLLAYTNTYCMAQV